MSQEEEFYTDLDELDEDLGTAASELSDVVDGLRFLRSSNDLDEPYKLEHHKIPRQDLKRLLLLIKEVQKLSDRVTDWKNLWEAK